MSYLISLTEAKEFMQITGTASDALISVYIDMIESEISVVVDRNLAIATYTESLSYLQSSFDRSDYTNLDAGQPAPKLFLKNYPVANITLSEGDTVVPTTSYTTNLDNGVISPDYQLSEPSANYVAGYTTVTAPIALKSVVKLGVTSLYNNNGTATQGSGDVTSKKIKDFSVSYGNNQTGFITQQDGKLVKNYIASNMMTLKRYMRTNL